MMLIMVLSLLVHILFCQEVLTLLKDSLVIRTRFNKPVRESTTYNAVVDVFAYDSKTKSLVNVGKKDMNELVNSFYEISLLSNKLQRFQNGDLTALNSRQGVYLDISGIPTDFNSLHKLVDSAMASVRDNNCDSIPQYIQMLLDNVDNKVSDSDKPIEKTIIDGGDSNE